MTKKYLVRVRQITYETVLVEIEAVSVNQARNIALAHYEAGNYDNDFVEEARNAPADCEVEITADQIIS